MINQNKGQRAVLYARKSTESEDKQVQSIDDQIRIMQGIAKDEDLEIIEILKESKSAKAPDVRPVFKQMMKDVRSRKYDVILAWDTSRLSRNPKDGGDIQWLIQNGTLHGIRTHEKWYRNNDDLLFTIENSMNGQFIRDLSDKVTRGMTSKADKGDYPSNPPVGYLNDRINKVIIADPIMFDRVAKLWQKALTGTYSVAELTRIARDELMIRTPKTKKTGGTPLCYSSVLNLLRNPFYTGKFRWADKIYNGNHPCMISDADFEKMQGIIDPKHASRPQDNKEQFLLRGLLTCKECGYAIVTEKKTKTLKDGTTKEYHYCHCCCKNPDMMCKNRSISVPESDLIDQIKSELSKYTIDEDFYELAIEALAEEDANEVSQQNEKIVQINKAITLKKNQLDALRRSVYTGLITDNAFYLSEQQSLSDEITKLQNDLRNVMAIATDWKDKATDIFLFARYAKEDFDSDDFERKRAVIKKLGAHLQLSGRTIVFTPVKYLVPVAKNHAELEAKKEADRTAPEQIKKDLEEDLISVWCT